MNHEKEGKGILGTYRGTRDNHKKTPKARKARGNVQVNELNESVL